MSDTSGAAATSEVVILEEREGSGAAAGGRAQAEVPGRPAGWRWAAWPRQQTWLCAVPLLIGFVGLGLSLMLLKWIVVGSVRDYVPTDLVDAKGIGQDPIFLSKPSAFPKGADAAATTTTLSPSGPGGSAGPGFTTAVRGRPRTGAPPNTSPRGAGASGSQVTQKSPTQRSRGPASVSTTAAFDSASHASTSSPSPSNPTVLNDSTQTWTHEQPSTERPRTTPARTHANHKTQPRGRENSRYADGYREGEIVREGDGERDRENIFITGLLSFRTGPEVIQSFGRTRIRPQGRETGRPGERPGKLRPPAVWTGSTGSKASGVCPPPASSDERTDAAGGKIQPFPPSLLHYCWAWLSGRPAHPLQKDASVVDDIMAPFKCCSAREISKTILGCAQALPDITGAMASLDVVVLFSGPSDERTNLLRWLDALGLFCHSVLTAQLCTSRPVCFQGWTVKAQRIPPEYEIFTPAYCALELIETPLMQPNHSSSFIALEAEHSPAQAQHFLLAIFSKF
ncbi:hypothetical protein P4O66_002068 [Electrophorus voltai]|uniref:Uncharacterized protein n=1 Tax=Electrophorus voltai TaxID=2609070 RepID=A0AAD8Z1Y8_9TELE|nr:hypothetical protein P4O66_002068 [Electrophorus voltai]